MVKDKKDKGRKERDGGRDADLAEDAYLEELTRLQVQLVQLQHEIATNDERVVIVFEGRDAAGKDGTITRVTQHMNPREIRIVSLTKPTEIEQSQWYFQRYVVHLPTADQIVIFNRSWYNRAGVERVMGFATDKQVEAFLDATPVFERMLVDDGVRLIKFYLDISRKTQVKRLEERRSDPLKQWKVGPIDQAAVEHWDDYSRARNEMFRRTHTKQAPWTIVKSDHKQAARLNVIRHLLTLFDYPGRDDSLLDVDTDVVFPFEESAIKDGRLAE